jgi:hypothetical protein
MIVSKESLIDLSDQWKDKVKKLSDEAHKIRKGIHPDAIEMPTTEGERSENIHGFAAGYSAARQELLRLLKVCEVCVGTGSTASQDATTKMRFVCWKCKGSGSSGFP